MHPDNEALLLLIVQTVGEYPAGVSTKDLCWRFSVSKDRLIKILGAARQSEMIGLTGGSINARWATPAIAAVMESTRWTKRRLQEKKARDKQKAGAKVEALSPPPKPIKLHAPNSVWQLKDFI